MPKDNEVDEKVIQRDALNDLLDNLSHDAGDVDDFAPSIDADEDAYWAYHQYHGIISLRRDAATVADLRAEVERLRTDAYKFRRLARLLDVFDFRLGRNVLMPPATYLDSVEITCEFQPGVGQSVIDAIMDTLTGADPT